MSYGFTLFAQMSGRKSTETETGRSALCIQTAGEGNWNLTLISQQEVVDFVIRAHEFKAVGLGLVEARFPC